MTTNYTGTASNVGSGPFAAPVPVDGDALQAATFTAALQALLDQTAFLQRATAAQAVENLSPATNANSANDFAFNLRSAYVAALDGPSTTHWSTSPGGKAFTNVASAVATRARGVVWAESLSLFVGVTSVSASGAVAIETGGTSGAAWTVRTVPITTSTGSPSPGCCIAFGAGTLVAALANVGQVISSTDGISWTARGTAVMSGKSIQAVIFAAGQFVAVASSNEVYTSPDGTTWTFRQQLGGSFVTGMMAAYSTKAGLFFISGLATTTNYYTSPDGVTWTARPFASVSALVALNGPLSIASAFGYFVMVGSVSGAGNLFISDDGIAWTHLNPTSGSLGAVTASKAAGNMYFVSQPSAPPLASLSLPSF